MKAFISKEDLRDFKEDFLSDRSNILAMNTVTANGLNESARQFTQKRKADHEYSLALRQNGITWQKDSGRCWMYSGFNILRDKVIEKLELEEFSFSGNYLMFYDKLEKANFYLEVFLENLDEPSDSRLMMEMLRALKTDGGEWEMFVSLVQKYGLVPAQAQPECVSTEASRQMAPVVCEKLRGFVRDIRRGYRAGKSVRELREMKEEMLETVYKMYCICYGEPVKTFDFKVRNKKGEFICDRGITPVEFYNKYVGVDLDNYVNLTAGSSNGAELKKFMYRHNGNVIEGKPISYVSVPIELLKETAIAQMKDGEPVWFGCDVGERSWREGGILDERLYDYEDLFNIKYTMTKAERFAYGQAHMSHAMTFKGVDLDEAGKPVAWRVENSWGPDVGKKGMFSMTDGWFDRYTYQVIVERRYVPADVLAVYDGDETEYLERWEMNI